MSEIDLFANQLLEEAKRFFEKAREGEDETGINANLHAALILSFCSLEAHVNAIGDEFSIRPDLSVQEKGLLLEKEVRLENGEFKLQSNLKIARLEERIEFMCVKLSGKPMDKEAVGWGKLVTAIKLRNELTHVKTIPSISDKAVQHAMEAIIGVLDGLYKAIYGTRFPPASRGVTSRLTF
jgi:hypothetical protein